MYEKFLSSNKFSLNNHFKSLKVGALKNFVVWQEFPKNKEKNKENNN